MSRLTFKINGVEFIHLIEYKGLKWSRNDLDNDSERVIDDAKMQRNRIGTKGKWEVQLRIVTAEELASICAAASPEYVNVTVLDPATNTVITKEFYGTSITAAVAFEDEDTVNYEECSFNLVER